MPFEIVSENGRNNPRAFCDHCGELILESGNVEWEWGASSATTRHAFKLFHKPCSREVNAERKAKGLPMTLWMPIDTFLIYLGNGIDVDWKQSMKQAERMASV